MDALLAGLVLGFGSGISPGPLLALVIAMTLRRGLGAGVQVAAAPLVTDLPIILLSVTVLSAVPSAAVGALGLVGALVVGWFAVESLRAARTAGLPTASEPADDIRPRAAALRRGALVNVANPAPWLFWATVGGPLLVSAWRTAPGQAVAWLVGFYVTLIGSKVLVALGLAAGRHRLTTRSYRALLAAAGLLMFGVAVLLARGAVLALSA